MHPSALPSVLPSARAVAARVLAAVLDGQPADRALKRALRAHPGLSSEERAQVADVVLGVACLQGRLRWLLARERREASVDALIERYLEDSGAADGVEWPSDPVERLAAERSLPAWLARRLVDERGQADADALAAALNQRGPITVRANTLVTTRAALARALLDEGIHAREGERSPWALHLEGRPNIRGSRAWRDGRFEVQDEGSQLLALATRARPGDVVIDACAGRGGKALALAAMIENEGRVLAYDVDGQRLDDLLPRRGRAHATCIEVVRDPSALPTDADVVLVDAPCSETGVLRRGPHRRWLLDEREVDRLPALQLEILTNASTLVRPGGRVVYATCSVLRAENEGVLGAFLEGHDGFVVEEEASWLPHVHGTDGFYCVALRRP